MKTTSNNKNKTTYPAGEMSDNHDETTHFACTIQHSQTYSID